MEKIYVTKTFLPPIEEYTTYLSAVFARAQLTNQGPLVQELEAKLTQYTGAKNVHFVSNGTIAIQLALNALFIDKGEVITTPFSYIATTSSILWEQYKPVFVDIEIANFTIDSDKIEAAITPKTRAILAVHVFGYACNVEKIKAIAHKYNLKVIYDAAHAFGSVYKGSSLLAYGDISTCSFHATKLFHTVEGGACITNNDIYSNVLELSKRFGHQYDDHIHLGINAKNSELHAAMGLANLPYIESIISRRKKISEQYDSLLGGFYKPQKQDALLYNYAYYPIVFESEQHLLAVFARLNAQDVFPRRYFYPSLNTISYVHGAPCVNSEDIALRVACLPLYVGLTEDKVFQIAKIINAV